MELEKVLHIRRSVRSFTREQITEEELRKILAAAQTARWPSAIRKSHWHTVKRKKK